jgi:hypothetical protein
MLVSVDHFGQLAERHPMSHRQRMMIDERDRIGRDERTSHFVSADGIGTIENHHPQPPSAAHAKHPVKGGRVGIEPRTRVLNVEHEGIDVRKHRRRGLEDVAIEAVHRQSRRGIARVGDPFVTVSQKAMLGSKERDELDTRRRAQEIDGAGAVSSRAGGVGDEPHVRALQLGELAVPQHVDTDLDGSRGRRSTAVDRSMRK